MATNISNDFPTAGAQPRIPDAPINWKPPQRGQGAIAPNAAIAAGNTAGNLFPVLGSGRIRIVAKYSAAGTLQAKWRLSDHITNQATNQPGTVALVANTENILDIPNNPGYAYLEVSILDGGAGGTVSYVDVFQTAVGN